MVPLPPTRPKTESATLVTTPVKLAQQKQPATPARQPATTPTIKPASVSTAPISRRWSSSARPASCINSVGSVGLTVASTATQNNLCSTR